MLTFWLALRDLLILAIEGENLVNKMKIISVDSEGLDLGFQEMIKAAIEFVKDYTDVILRIFVLEQNMLTAAKMIEKHSDRIMLLSCKLSAKTSMETRIILNDLHEGLKKYDETRVFSSDYSMTNAVFDVYSKNSEACLIPGHAGHLVFIARSIERKLGNLKHEAHALVTEIPSTGKTRRVMLDLGGLVNQDLYKLALAGSSYAKHFFKVKHPKVAFMNIGTEYNKGHLHIREAAEKFKQDYPESVFGEHGFIEPDKVFMDSECNVVVTDGFTGNSVLKASEGALKVIVSLIKGFVKKSLISHLLAFPIKHIMKKVFVSLNLEKTATAMLLGFTKPILKSHGGSDAKILYNSLLSVRNCIPEFKAFIAKEIN